MRKIKILSLNPYSSVEVAGETDSSHSASQWDRGQESPDCCSRLGPGLTSSELFASFSTLCPSVIWHSQMCYLHRKDFYCRLHTGPVKSIPLLLPPLFWVAMHSLAYGYNIYLYLCYLLLYLKSLGSTHDGKARDFLSNKLLCEALDHAWDLDTGSSQTRSRPRVDAWISAWKSKCGIHTRHMGARDFRKLSRRASELVIFLSVHTDSWVCQTKVL